jgi:hypothetical protein
VGRVAGQVAGVPIPRRLQACASGTGVIPAYFCVARANRRPV